MSGSDAHRTIETVWRMEAPRLIAGLARLTRDVGRAEELAQDALVAALKQWPEEGVPRNPAAWLMQVAKHRALDAARHEAMTRRKQDEIGLDIAGEAIAPDLDEALDDEVGDDLLRLIFTACHPVLPKEARLALTLRLLGGLTTEEIARAFLVPEATMAQRIVRAKKTLSDASVPYEVPAGAELGERLATVLEVVYLIFNEGYAATAGQDWVRPPLCEEALRLGRILAARAPQEPEVHGLVALMELQASRLRARAGPNGEPILLLDQNRARWDRLLIGRGLAALERAQRLAGALPGPYLLQAALAACHARARTAAETDWGRIVALYGVLGRVAPSPIVELNRAVAVGMEEGPAAGLELVEALAAEPALKRYHLLPSVRGDLLAKLGRHREAAEAFEQAVALTRNVKERALMEERAATARAAAGSLPA
jgi:RNA polymerase sigma factor (sigma-70 family)